MIFFFKQKTAYEMRISDWSSDVCSSDLMMQMIFAREFARTAGGLLWVWGLTSFGGAKSIGLYGTDEQKERWLRPMAEGKLRVSLSMTEPDGGTDVLGDRKSVV